MLQYGVYSCSEEYMWVSKGVKYKMDTDDRAHGVNAIILCVRRYNNRALDTYIMGVVWDSNLSFVSMTALSKINGLYICTIL